MRAMISVEEALQIVGLAAGAPRARGERVALCDALGRVLAEDVRLDLDMPPFDRSAMDGYAVRAADVRADALPRRLPVVAHVLAGASSPRALAAGESMAIMTGAPVPDGADLVIPIEWTSDPDAKRGEETSVSIDRTAPAGSSIAHRGGQAREGEIVASAGCRISPALLGALAAAGRATLEVAAPPRVEILATGDELVPLGHRPGPSQIRDSNGHALLAQTTAAGGRGIYRGPIADDGDRLRAAISAALSADLVLLTGGVSVGEKDLVPGVLEDLGVERLFHKWAVKPGGPLWFGKKGSTLVFGLPGNPAAAFVGFEVLVAPAIAARLGRPFAPRRAVRARISSPLPAPISRRQYVPVALDLSASPASATPVAWSGSGDPFGLARAQGLAIVPGAGEAVHAHADGFVDVVPALAAGLGGAS